MTAARQTLTCPNCGHRITAPPGHVKQAARVHYWPCSVATTEERAAWQTTRRWPKRVSDAARVAQRKAMEQAEKEADGPSAEHAGEPQEESTR